MRRIILLFLLLFSQMYFYPENSFAHSRVSGTTPSDGSIINVSPESFYITFNEKVTINDKSFKLIDINSEIIDLNNIETTDQGEGVIAKVQIPFKIINWAAISYEVISLDGHTINGVVSFSVGDEYSNIAEEGRLLKILNADPLSIYKNINQVLRYINYIATFLIIGLLGFLSYVSRYSRKNEINIEETFLHSSNKITTFIALSGAVVSPIIIFLNSFILNSGEFEDLGIAFSISVGTPTGLSFLIKTSAFFAICTAALLLIDKKTKFLGKVVFIIGCIATVYSFIYSGHPNLVPKEILSKTALFLHNIAGGLWLGGLVILSYLLYKKKIKNNEKIIFITGFSFLATASLILLVPSSLLLSFTMFTTPSELFTTEYGIRLLMKVSFVFLLAIIGAYNHYILVPKTIETNNIKNIKKVVILESSGLFFVIFLTFSLTNFGAPAAGGSHISHLGTFSEEIASNPKLADLLPTIVRAKYKDGEVEVRINPSRAGEINEFEFIFKDKNNYVVSNINNVTLELIIPKINSKIVRKAEKNSINNWILKTNDIGIDGIWEIKIITNKGDIKQDFTSLTIPIKTALLSNGG